ncbi:hypothetical protein D3C72_1510130 [compost metagenome]
MPARVLHQLRRRIEPHRLAVQQRAQECRRMVAFEPGADIHQLGKTGRMALRKTIFAEPLDLLADRQRERFRIAIAGQRAHQRVLVLA